MRNIYHNVDVTVDPLTEAEVDKYMDGFCGAYWSSNPQWWRRFFEPSCSAHKLGANWAADLTFPGWLPQAACRWMCVRILRKQGIGLATISSSRSLIYDGGDD